LKGIIHRTSHTIEGKNADYACFLCPHCNQVHCLYISIDKKEEVKGLHIWQYKPINDSLIELNPSYNNEISEKNPLGCGYHSSNPWQIEPLTLEEWTNLLT
jgi:hypothetical protein